MSKLNEYKIWRIRQGKLEKKVGDGKFRKHTLISSRLFKVLILKFKNIKKNE
jgi:hypothetical protein